MTKLIICFRASLKSLSRVALEILGVELTFDSLLLLRLEMFIVTAGTGNYNKTCE